MEVATDGSVTVLENGAVVARLASADVIEVRVAEATPVASEAPAEQPVAETPAEENTCTASPCSDSRKS
ncbi:hypothetical protein [Streptococcus marmotae]|uniref:hypothetical protein n=1 Tax=Streptococcus marmotae TaxID=1825069 RepID=UPI000832E409|nr:hypothetical protein [Streptococcus marmotae]